MGNAMVSEDRGERGEKPPSAPVPHIKEPPKTDWSPRRKVLAAGAGGGLGGPVAVILAHHLPGLPSEVVAAYTAILLIVLSVGAAYLVPER